MEQPDIQESVAVENTLPESINLDEPAVPNDDPEGLLSEGDSEEVTQEELDEIEHEGEKFKIPKKLKDAFLRQADYTQKTQQVAEQRRAIEVEREQFSNIQRVHQQHLQEIATVTAIDNQLSQFREVNWQGLSDQDPVQAQKLFFQFNQLQTQRGQLVAQIQQKQAQALNEQQQSVAKQIQEGQAELQRDIKGWSPEIQAKLLSYGKEVGFKENELQGITDPRSVKLLHKAFMYDQLVKKQQTKPAPQEANVVSKVGASSGAVQKSPDKMTDAEFAQWRKRQIAQRR